MSCLEKQTPQKVFLELQIRKSVFWKVCKWGETRTWTQGPPQTSGRKHMCFPRWHCSTKLQYFSQMQGHLSSLSWAANCTVSPWLELYGDSSSPGSGVGHLILQILKGCIRASGKRQNMCCQEHSNTLLLGIFGALKLTLYILSSLQ